RDARFAIANQFAIIAEELDLDAHEAINIANDNYPRNNIPLPGTVGGKCLTKDPHFIMDKSFFEQHSSPDLFYHTRKVNTIIEDRIFDRILKKQPENVAVLGTGFKKDNGDEFKSPAIRIKNRLEETGIETDAYDPHVEGRDNLEATIEGSDLVLIAVNHSEFEKREREIKSLAGNQPVIDVWGIFDKGENVERFGGPEEN
ncbi:MAG: UDP binding domain-containing protein, partial [Candidatus Nanohaloarchaea archaeon]